MAGAVVGVPALGLKSQERSHPTVFGREMQQHAAILPHAVVLHEFFGIALIHVDIVNPVTRLEPEVLVAAVRFRTPAFSERIDHRILLGERPLDMEVDLLIQIVVQSGNIKRQGRH